MMPERITQISFYLNMLQTLGLVKTFVLSHPYDISRSWHLLVYMHNFASADKMPGSQVPFILRVFDVFK